MFTTHNDAGYRETLKGIRQKTLVYGRNTLMVEFRLEAGTRLPLHRHPHEQTGYLVSGRMDLTVGQESRRQEPGDSWCIPGDTEHGATALEDCVAVEVFAPVREDYLPQPDDCPRP